MAPRSHRSYIAVVDVDAVEEMRRSRRMTYTDLAEQMGVSPSTLFRVLARDAYPGIPFLAGLYHAFGPYSLITLVDYPKWSDEQQRNQDAA